MPPARRRRGGAEGTGRNGTQPSKNLPGNLVVVSRSVRDLIADPQNARRHPERNVRAIMTALDRFGLQTPIVIDQHDVVRKGNGTLIAADRLGWESIDCVVTGLSGDEATAYAIADNRTSDLASWDVQQLAESLQALDPDLVNAAGYSDDELHALAAKLPKLPGGDDDEDGPAYRGPQMKTMFLQLDQPVYEWLVQQLDACKARRNLNTNGEAIVALVASATRSKPPVR